MRRWLPFLILAFLLHPPAAAAEVWAFGETGSRTAASSARAAPEPEPTAVLTSADGLLPGSSPRDPTGRTLVDAARASSPPFRTLREWPPLAACASLRGGICPPHCERLPYHATAPPLR